jgi:monofunctional biosynthetic peptidoglycan transglycosylase
VARARKRRRKSSPLRRYLALAVALIALLSVVIVVPWRWLAPPTTAVMWHEHRSHRAPVHYRWVNWDEIAPDLAIAVVAAEDQKFPYHYGFDFASIRKALHERPERPRGASTISQQVAKNLFLWRDRSLLRKGIEAYLTILIEVLWPKRRILEVYLNVAEFAPGLYGAGAASELLFGKPARALTLTESVLLAAVLPNPREMSASAPSDYVRERAASIRSAIEKLGGPRYLAGL